MFAKAEIIRDTKYLRMVSGLRCIITGANYGVHAHHLLRTPEKAMGQKSGDDKVLPLNYIVHDLLHREGDETAFLLINGIKDPIEICAELYSRRKSEHLMQDYLTRRFGHLWRRFERREICTNHILRPVKPHTQRSMSRDSSTM